MIYNASGAFLLPSEVIYHPNNLKRLVGFKMGLKLKAPCTSITTISGAQITFNFFYFFMILLIL